MPQIQLIERWKKILESHSNALTSFITQNKSLSSEYLESKEDVSEIGFNVFTLSSDLYYRENFHSDIIKSFLNPSEKHQQDTNFLFQFIDLLNKGDSKQKINKHEFKNAVVSREKNNIDILILDDTSKKAIIIENKINNAVDQKRQLCRYYDIIQKTHSVNAIVYLTLNSSKRPDKNDWNENELSKINPILRIIPAYDRSKLNLYQDWIIPSIINTNDADSLFILRQYGKLLKYLNTSSMDTVSLEKFYNTLKDSDNLNTSISIKNMLNDLPEYLAIRIEDKYKNNCSPFRNVWRYQRTDTVFEAFEIENLYLKMDIWCSENGYKIQLWNPKNEEYDVKENLKDFNALIGFEYIQNKKNTVVKTFSFHQEGELYNFIDMLKEELKTLINHSVIK